MRTSRQAGARRPGTRRLLPSLAALPHRRPAHRRRRRLGRRRGVGPCRAKNEQTLLSWARTGRAPRERSLRTTDESISGAGYPHCVHNLPDKPISAWLDPLPKDYFKETPSSAAAAAQPKSPSGTRSQLSSAGWRNWPVVEEGDYSLVYVVPDQKFGYYDDDEDEDECIVYFGEPLINEWALARCSSHGASCASRHSMASSLPCRAASTSNCSFWAKVVY